MTRGAGFVVAAALGVVGVWLVVTGSDSKSVRVGAICAFWGLLIGTYSIFGSKVPGGAPELAAAPAPAAPPPRQELDLRQIGELERSAVAAARREFQQELQLMLRRELHSGFTQELASLRSEVDAMRSELVEKVGGQLRLERIETTRLIGSDLEAVQTELRKLRHFAGEPGAPAAPVPVAPIAARDPAPVPREPASVDATGARNDVADIHDAEVVEDSHDPFAAMPRLTPFTDVDLGPDTAAPAPAAEQPPTGRRHRADDDGNDVLARILAREQR